MATYTVVSVKHATLVAATVDTVTLTGGFSEVEVVKTDDTTDNIYFTTDGTAPTVGGADTQVVAGGRGAYKRAAMKTTNAVKVISAGTPAYSVGGVA